MRDRTMKFLLTLIAVALWGLLLRPALTPIPAKAADDPSGPKPALVVTDRGVYVSTLPGYVYLLDASTLAVKARAVPTSLPDGTLTYRADSR